MVVASISPMLPLVLSPAPLFTIIPPIPMVGELALSVLDHQPFINQVFTEIQRSMEVVSLLLTWDIHLSTIQPWIPTKQRLEEVFTSVIMPISPSLTIHSSL